MRGLTLYQPWASLVALGGKRWETRSWGTAYRGPLLIHAALRKPPVIDDRRFVEEALQVLGVADWDELPRGVVLAVADLANVAELSATFTVASGAFSARELVFGDYRAGRYAWKLDNVRRLEIPLPVAGRRGLWVAWPELMAKLEGSVRE
jgi:hypothetical protein